MPFSCFLQWFVEPIVLPCLLLFVWEQSDITLPEVIHWRCLCSHCAPLLEDVSPAQLQLEAHIITRHWSRCCELEETWHSTRDLQKKYRLNERLRGESERLCHAVGQRNA